MCYSGRRPMRYTSEFFRHKDSTSELLQSSCTEEINLGAKTVHVSDSKLYTTRVQSYV